MKKAFVLFIVFILAGNGSFASVSEEFYIVTNGPVAVGGGMVRHYLTEKQGRVSTRYSYGGVEKDAILVEKEMRSPRTGFSMSETIRIPFSPPVNRQSGWLEVGSHTVLLTVNRHGRIVVREEKDPRLVKNEPSANIH
ncbi:MAG: hypothetical protein WBD00_05625 [Candidatus Omnitrophota bacterium]